MRNWFRNVLIGAVMVGAWLYALWRERKYARVEQKLRDQIEASKQRQAIERASNATAEAADSRSDPRLHDRVDIIVPDTLPEWSRRD